MIRSNILYDKNNKLISYKEDGVNNDGQKYHTDMFDMTYDKRGNVQEYRNRNIVAGISTDTHRFNMTYDTLDRAYGLEYHTE
jgi:hypothetical protein